MQSTKSKRIICQFDNSEGIDFIIFFIPSNRSKDVRAIRVTEFEDLQLIRDTADQAIKSRLRQCERIVSESKPFSKERHDEIFKDLAEKLKKRLREIEKNGGGSNGIDDRSKPLSTHDFSESIEDLGKELQDIIKLREVHRTRQNFCYYSDEHKLLVIEFNIPGITIRLRDNTYPELPFRYIIGQFPRKLRRKMRWMIRNKRSEKAVYRKVAEILT